MHMHRRLVAFVTNAENHLRLVTFLTTAEKNTSKQPPCRYAECHCTARHVAGRKGNKQEAPAHATMAAELKAGGAGAGGLGEGQQEKKPRRRFLFLRRRQKPADAGETGSAQQVTGTCHAVRLSGHTLLFCVTCMVHQHAQHQEACVCAAE